MLLELQQVVMPENAAEGTSDQALESLEGCHDARRSCRGRARSLHVIPEAMAIAHALARHRTSLQAVNPQEPAETSGISAADLSTL